jgi:hypothetical protein
VIACGPASTSAPDRGVSAGRVAMFGYRYFVLVTEGFPRESPYGLIRVRKGEPVSAGVEHFTPGTGWERSPRVTSDLVRNGAVPISPRAVKHYERLLAERGEGADGTVYQYYLVSPDGFPAKRPVALIRKRDTGFTSIGEERFTKELRWEDSDMLDRIESGREYDEAKEITEEEARAYIERVTRMVENGEA